MYITNNENNIDLDQKKRSDNVKEKVLKILKYIFEYIFIISFLYYVALIGYALYCAFFGIEWWGVMPAMGNSNEEMMAYGIWAFIEGLFIGILVTVLTPFRLIPIYQIIYIVYRIIKLN